MIVPSTHSLFLSRFFRSLFTHSNQKPVVLCFLLPRVFLIFSRSVSVSFSLALSVSMFFVHFFSLDLNHVCVYVFRNLFFPVSFVHTNNTTSHTPLITFFFSFPVTFSDIAMRSAACVVSFDFLSFFFRPFFNSETHFLSRFGVKLIPAPPLACCCVCSLSGSSHKLFLPVC